MKLLLYLGVLCLKACCLRRAYGQLLFLQGSELHYKCLLSLFQLLQDRNYCHSNILPPVQRRPVPPGAHALQNNHRLLSRKPDDKRCTPLFFHLQINTSVLDR